MNRPNWFYLFPLLAIYLLVFVPLAQQYRASDFSYYYGATCALISGLNPYQPDPSQQFVLAGQVVTSRIWGPPLALFPLIPFTLMPYFLAEKLFDLFLLLSSFFSFSYLMKKQSLQNIIPAAILFPLGIIHSAIFWQSPTWIILFAVVIGIAAIKAEKYFLAGALLSFFWLKPHLGVILALPILVFCLKQKKYSFIYGALAGSLVMSLAVFALRTTIFLDYSASFIDQQPFNFINFSLPSQINQLLGLRYPLILFLPAIIISFLVAWHANFTSLEKLIALLLPISITFAPYCWLHDYVLVIPFLVIILEQAKNGILGNFAVSLVLIASFLEKFFGYYADVDYGLLSTFYGIIISVAAFVLIRGDNSYSKGIVVEGTYSEVPNV